MSSNLTSATAVSASVKRICSTSALSVLSLKMVANSVAWRCSLAARSGNRIPRMFTKPLSGVKFSTQAAASRAFQASGKAIRTSRIARSASADWAAMPAGASMIAAKYRIRIGTHRSDGAIGELFMGGNVVRLAPTGQGDTVHDRPSDARGRSCNPASLRRQGARDRRAARRCRSSSSSDPRAPCMRRSPPT